MSILSKKSHDGQLIAGGLKIEQIIPFKKWRIVYNGLAKVHNTNLPINYNFVESCDETELQHVIFTFL